MFHSTQFALYHISHETSISALLTHWQNGRYFPDDIFKCILWMKIYEFRLGFHWSLFLRQINDIPALVLIMAWRPPGDRPLSETMMVRLLTHTCVTRPQWVNTVLHAALDIMSSHIITFQTQILLATLFHKIPLMQWGLLTHWHKWF